MSPTTVTPDERQALIERFAREHDVPVERVYWNTALDSPQVVAGIVRPGSSRVDLDLARHMSDRAIWTTILAQGGIDGVVVDDEVRQSERYQQILADEVVLVGADDQLDLMADGAPVSSPLGRLLEGVRSLVTNLTTPRPYRELLLAEARVRADRLMSYELTIEQLGRDIGETTTP